MRARRNKVHTRVKIDPRPLVWPTALAMLFLVLMMFLVSSLLIERSYGMDHGFDHNDATVKWFEKQLRPDQPPLSCCGKGDAYPVDRYIHNPHEHTYTVWLHDGSAIKYPDGTRRDYFDKSVPIEVPENKVNPLEDDQDNPTDFSWIYMRVSTPTDPGTIYCFIRHPNLN